MVADGGMQLSLEERNLFAVAIKNTVGSARAAARQLRDRRHRDAPDASAAQRYYQRLKAEADGLCAKSLEMVETLLACAEREAEQRGGAAKLEAAETAIFYLKMRADLSWYLIEFSDGEEKAEYQRKAAVASSEAQARAELGLPATHPLRLAMGLSLSVWRHDVEGRSAEAIELARRTVDATNGELDTLDEDSYKDATLIMQLLRDNLRLWTAEETE